jgi:hypothetical protein
MTATGLAGIVAGSINPRVTGRGCTRFDAAARGASGGGPGGGPGGATSEIWISAFGSISGLTSGMASAAVTINACRPNDVIRLQPVRTRDAGWTKLCSNMASSSIRLSRPGKPA